MAQDQQIVASAEPTRKTIAATGGSVLGAAIATLVLYALDPDGRTLPPNVRGAITTIVTALVTLTAAYFVPAAPTEGIMVVDGRTLIGRVQGAEGFAGQGSASGRS